MTAVPLPVTQMESSPAPASTRVAPRVRITSSPAVPMTVPFGDPSAVSVQPVAGRAARWWPSSAWAGGPARATSGQGRGRGGHPTRAPLCATGAGRREDMAPYLLRGRLEGRWSAVMGCDARDRRNVRRRCPVWSSPHRQISSSRSVEDPGPELQGIDRDPLVDSVEQPAKSRSAGSRSGAKPKHRIPSSAKYFASVPPLIRYGARSPGVLGLSAGHRVTTSPSYGLPAMSVKRSLVTSSPNTRRRCPRTRPRSQAGTDRRGRAGLRRDDVHLVPRLEHRRVDCCGSVAEHPGHSPSSATSVSTFSGVASVPAARPPSPAAARIVGVSRDRPLVRPIRATASASGDRVVWLTIEPCPGRPWRSGASRPCPSRPSRSGRAGGRATVRLKPPTSPIASVQSPIRSAVLTSQGRARCRRPPRRRGSRAPGALGHGRPRSRAHDGEDHRVHVLHVDRAASPHAAVADLARERVDRPVLGRRPARRRGGRGRAVRPRPVGPSPRRPTSWCGPARTRRPRLDADLVELRRDVFGGLAFPRTGLVAVVGVSIRIRSRQSSTTSPAVRTGPVGIGPGSSMPVILRGRHGRGPVVLGGPFT